MILGSKLLINEFDLPSNDLNFFTSVLLNDGFNKLWYDEKHCKKLKNIFCRFICEKSVLGDVVFFSQDDTFL